MKFEAEIYQSSPTQWNIYFADFPEWLAAIFTKYNRITIGSTGHRSGADALDTTAALLLTAHRFDSVPETEAPLTVDKLQEMFAELMQQHTEKQIDALHFDAVPRLRVCEDITLRPLNPAHPAVNLRTGQIILVTPSPDSSLNWRFTISALDENDTHIHHDIAKNHPAFEVLP